MCTASIFYHYGWQYLRFDFECLSLSSTGLSDRFLIRFHTLFTQRKGYCGLTVMIINVKMSCLPKAGLALCAL